MLKLLIVFGTRPEAIKLAPVIQGIRQYPDQFTCRICVTAQHRQMLDPLLHIFTIQPDYDLNIMQPNQSLEHITTAVLTQIGDLIRQEQPDYLMVQGDTTTGMTASLAAYYQKVKVAHIEAGLRTWDKWHPYPEEINRKIIDAVSEVYFAHTEQARQNLLREGIPETQIQVTGNTVIDALLDVAQRECEISGTPLEQIPFHEKRIVLVTAHRRENFGQPIQNICHALKEIALKRPDVCIVYPVHLNPNIYDPVHASLAGIKNIVLLPPLAYEAFIYLMKHAYFLLTDSGGLQEEAPGLDKPVLVLREITERPEAVEAGTVEVIGTNTNRIIQQTLRLLDHRTDYERMARARNPYGDGKASKRIVSYFLKVAAHEQ